jgi:DNA-binding response OmpR family regulator
MTTIVLVEADADIRELTTIMLEAEGHQVVAFEDGRPALAHCTASPPDLVVLDCMLPAISGLGVLRRLRAHPATIDVPVIMVSAFSEPSNVEAARRAGAREFVAKPFSRAHLMAVVRDHLEASSLARQTPHDISA